MDNVLLCTLYLGVLEHTPHADFLSIAQLGVFWSILFVNFLLRKYI